MPRQSHPHYSRAEFIRAGTATLGTAVLAPFLSASTMTAQESAASATPPPPATSQPIALDLREFIRWVTESFEPSVRLPGGAGRYARKFGDAVPEIYGVADMACILYTIDQLNPSEAERAEWAKVFQSFQTAPLGMLVEKTPTHGLIHNTAFALAGMELFNLHPAQPITLAPEHRDIRTFLETIDWVHGVYPGSHAGAGIGAICALVPELRDPVWFENYFSACEALIDPRNGMLGRGKPAGGDYDQIGGTFHYAFLFSHFNRLMPYPEQRIDAILGLQQPDGYWAPDNHLWLTFDAMYLLTRASRVCPHRRDEIVAVVRRLMQLLATDVFSPEGRARTFVGKLPVHSLTAALSAAAEAQIFLGHREIITERPLRLIVDRRPFI